ncbi:MAG: helix-turn-helix domain-containing protein [Mycolicibacterium sp.]|uniref:helix-turn-helix domain-containing protein n=1 Tax=Mycolicibacterium sp. TaxID=2320850 RepID=UPI003D0D5115
MKNGSKVRDGRPRSEVAGELRKQYERGASIRTIAESTGYSYGSVHSMLREAGAAMRSRGGPNHRGRR